MNKKFQNSQIFNWFVPQQPEQMAAVQMTKKANQMLKVKKTNGCIITSLFLLEARLLNELIFHNFIIILIFIIQ
jgi:hypothetical protein